MTLPPKAPPISIDVLEGSIVVFLRTAVGKHGGTLTPERARELAEQLRGAAEYVDSMKGTT